jgi:hypothetical protein
MLVRAGSASAGPRGGCTLGSAPGLLERIEPLSRRDSMKVARHCLATFIDPYGSSRGHGIPGYFHGSFGGV